MRKEQFDCRKAYKHLCHKLFEFITTENEREKEKKFFLSPSRFYSALLLDIFVGNLFFQVE